MTGALARPFASRTGKGRRLSAEAEHREASSSPVETPVQPYPISSLIKADEKTERPAPPYYRAEKERVTLSARIVKLPVERRL